MRAPLKKEETMPDKHAVVLGSGMAGLAAAGVLASRFERVTLLERDPEPAAGEPRKGVPQGRHVHILLKAGAESLDRIFSGLTAELEAAGSCRVDFCKDFWWFHHGVWKASHESELILHMQSRPLLEAIVRRRVQGLGNVDLRYRTAATALAAEAGRIRAVRVQSDGLEQTLAADLVVDASGRGSQLLRWLQELGFPAPPEERLGLDLQYASRIYRARPDPERGWKAVLVYQTPPEETRIGGLFPLEDGRWMVTVVGYAGDHPPGDDVGFLDFVRSLARPDIYMAVRDAEPLTEVETFRFPTARWLHFEELKRFPSGLVPLGDTVCSFDPVFGQGMSVAAMGALRLASYLDRDREATDVRPFLLALAGIAAVPWLLTSSEDLRYPQVAGHRPVWLPLLQAYTQRAIRLTGSSAPAWRRFARLVNLLVGPEVLFHPGTVAGILGRSLRPSRRLGAGGRGARRARPA
jgi:2-polyprenyl-6-methoxyphenol hydroxylase-like FAD-dependent oxidoreductase